MTKPKKPETEYQRIKRLEWVTHMLMSSAGRSDELFEKLMQRMWTAPASQSNPEYV